MAKKTQRPSVINMNYRVARDMSHEYTEMDEQYLRSLVRNHIPNAENVLSCSDRKYLLHLTRTIKGVSDRLMKSYNKKINETKRKIMKNIESLANSQDLAEKELLDERICIQLEGNIFLFNSELDKRYQEINSSYQIYN